MPRLLIIATVLTLVGCAPIEDEPLLDDEGVPIPVPGPYDDWLEVESIEPTGGEVSLRPQIAIRFNAHLEDDLIVDFGVAWLASGGIRAGGRSQYDVKNRTLVFVPNGPLIEGLEYRLFLNPAMLESVTGAPPQLGSSPVFVASSEIELPSQEPAAPVWSAVANIFEAKCWGCHQDPQWQLNPLTPASMVGVTADGADALLITRYDPADSYLMHKVIRDYPVRRYGVQPPTWSDVPSLSAKEVSVIQAWIGAGAP